MAIEAITTKLSPGEAGLAGSAPGRPEAGGSEFARLLGDNVLTPGIPVERQLLAERLALALVAGALADEAAPAPLQLTQALAGFAANGPGQNADAAVQNPTATGPAPVGPRRQPEPEPVRAHGVGALIERAAERYNLPAKLIASVVRAESNFNPRAVSRAGAQGLMQLMPKTAAGLGVTDPFDPQQNIMAGSRFLRDLLDRYHGDLDKALAAYNWGPGNVDKKYPRLPEETRAYVATVRAGLDRG